MPSQTPWAFSSSRAAAVLHSACAEVGLDDRDAALLRLGENAIYGLSGASVVARIARSVELLPRVEKELRVARWFAGHEFPAARIAEHVERQPRVVDGHPVTFWELVVQSGPAPTFVDLALMLRRLHELPAPAFDLPVFDPFPKVRRRLEHADGIPAADRAFLLECCERAEKEYARLEFALPSGVIHGDAHRGNLLRCGDEVRLLDFEEFAVGPREWDLTPTALGVRRFGLRAADFQPFADAYGFDVMSWEGSEVLQRMRELTMTTWLMQNLDEHPDIAAEFALRVESMRDGTNHHVWQPF